MVTFSKIRGYVRRARCGNRKHLGQGLNVFCCHSAVLTLQATVIVIGFNLNTILTLRKQIQNKISTLGRKREKQATIFFSCCAAETAFQTITANPPQAVFRVTLTLKIKKLPSCPSHGVHCIGREWI